MLITVGRVGKAHGIRGSVTIQVLTDEPESRFVVGSPITTEPTLPQPLVIAGLKWHSGRLLMDFEGITDRTAAESLRGTLLQVEVDQFERPEDPDEYYDHQLVGLNVRTVNGELLGTIAEISHLPAQDLLVVTPVAAVDESTGPKAEYLIPFVQAIVMSVDLETGLIVDPPLGLLGEIAEPDSSDTDA